MAAMGQNILNEQEADEIVNRILAREKARKKGITPMSKIVLFKDTDGAIKQAQAFETVTRQDIESDIEKAKQFLASLENALADFDNLAAEDENAAAAPVAEVVDTPAPVAAEAPAPEATPAPTAETQPAPATDTPAAPAPVAEAAPAEAAPVETTAPAEQPAAAPVAEAPATTPIVIQ